MNLSEYQKKAATTAIYPNLLECVIGFAEARDTPEHIVDYLKRPEGKCWNVSPPNYYYPALGLAGEAGEIANKVKKIMRDDNCILTDEKKEDLIGELGDVLWYLAALATELGIDLGEVAEKNIEKLFSRKERGKLGGSGDAR